MRKIELTPEALKDLEFTCQMTWIRKVPEYISLVFVHVKMAKSEPGLFRNI